MSKLVYLLSFLSLSLVSSAAPGDVLIGRYQDSIKAETAHIKDEMKIQDTLFVRVVDSLSGYAVDTKFTPDQQVKNLYGLYNFMKHVSDRGMYREGKYTDMLRFGFSIMDWRKEGTLYENLKSYSKFALRCASFFSKDKDGIGFIANAAESDPDQILISADQLSYSNITRRIIEDAILKDPDFAKRYFYRDNMVTYYASGSRNNALRDIYEIFDTYGTKTKAFILYDAIAKKRITVKEVDSISVNNNALIHELVNILSSDSPIGIKSALREMDFRSVEWMRQSTQLSPDVISARFSKYSPGEKLTIIAFGYRECNPRMLSIYLSLLRKTNLSDINAALIKNLSGGPLPSFLTSLDKGDQLAALLGSFGKEDKSTLTRLLSTNEIKDEQPELRVVPAPIPNQAKSTTVKNIPAVKLEIKVTKEPVAEDNIAVDPIHITLNDSSRAMLGIKRNIFMALQDIPSFIHKPYAKDALLYAASVEPDEVFKKIELYKGEKWSKEVLEKATLNAPINARRYFTNTAHPVTTILKYSNNQFIKTLLKISDEAEYQSKPFLLFDDMAHHSLSLKDATVISASSALLFKELMVIAARDSYLGKYNVENEMNYYSLRFIRAINDKVSQPDKIHFASVNDLSCDELYYLMVYGREEVFNSTFNGLFKRLEEKCTSSNASNAEHFLSYPHYRSFIALCATYNKLDKFLSLFSATDQKRILIAFASSLDTEADELTEAATVAETVANTTNPGVLQVLQNTIKASYNSLDSIQRYNGMSIYGILAALFKDKALTDKIWFEAMARKYKTGVIATLTNASLMDQKPFVERMYFYDDNDGRDSYQNFIKTFSASPNWKIEQHYSYVKVVSVHGAKVEIYANKAELEEGGEKEISKIVTDNGYTVQCIVHRGHSFHTESTLMKVPSSARIIFVGSCGGFYKINIALRKAPEASIISTRQIGAKQINDLIIYNLNEYVRQGKDINWKTFWDEVRVKVGNNSQFYDYVPPHKNIESLFVRAYYEIMGG